MAARGFLDQIPLLERIRLARNLALAVLQFHATPFLTSSWNGDDVVFFGLQGDSSGQPTDIAERLPESYLRVRVMAEDLDLEMASRPSGSYDENPIRNGYLFRLGIALLELALPCSPSQSPSPFWVDFAKDTDRI